LGAKRNEATGGEPTAIKNVPPWATFATRLTALAVGGTRVLTFRRPEGLLHSMPLDTSNDIVVLYR
jgi:hypothetical protein